MRLGTARHLHFVGVGGAGMCGLAELALQHGYAVSGCDLDANPRTEHLVDAGVHVLLGHDPSHVESVDVVVTSSAVPEDLPELVAARRAGVPLVSRARLLAEVERTHLGIAVSGTHGKTTTAALLTHLLLHSGFDPTAVLGGRLLSQPGHARRGAGDLFVYEADEYRSAFLTMRPAWMIVTNVEAEHLETFDSTEHLEAAFIELASRVPFYGCVVACGDDPGACRVRDQAGVPCRTYGLGEQAWLRADRLRATSEGWRADVIRDGEALGSVSVPLAGRHNVSNSLGALAVCLELGVPFDGLAKALEEFPGVARRLEVKGRRGGTVVVDDYAHHPTEVRAALEAARQAWPSRTVVAVFEPHLYSRTRMFAEQFASALSAADVVFVMPVQPAREEPILGVDAGLIVAPLVRSGGCRVQQPATDDEALHLLDTVVGDEDLVLTLGAGPIDRIGEAWLEGGS